MFTDDQIFMFGCLMLMVLIASTLRLRHRVDDYVRMEQGLALKARGRSIQFIERPLAPAIQVPLTMTGTDLRTLAKKVRELRQIRFISLIGTIACFTIYFVF